jgi:hypothetical protein
LDGWCVAQEERNIYQVPGILALIHLGQNWGFRKCYCEVQRP